MKLKNIYIHIFNYLTYYIKILKEEKNNEKEKELLLIL